MRVSVNRQAARDDARVVAFELGNCFLLQHRMLADAVGLKPIAALVWLTVGTATIQKYMRQNSQDPAYRTAVPLPVELSGGVSRRAIARTTGLPTETVRRCVADLIAIGYLEIVSPQLVRTPPGSISMISEAHVDAMLAAVAYQAQALARVGVLKISQGAPTASNRSTPAGKTGAT